MSDHMALMSHLKCQDSTHSCPECESPAYCAMEAGKSANLCWCMTAVRESKPETTNVGDICLCKGCLK